MKTKKQYDDIAIVNFRKYLRIPSISGGNCNGCIEFLQSIASELNLPYSLHYPIPNKPLMVITWVGKKPNLPSIVLNGHMDVVPVIKEEWEHDPFGAEMDDKGNIFARGAQDMKCVTIQELEAIRRLIDNKHKLERTIHITLTPDEEIGSMSMKKFVDTEEYKNLNVGFCLDEGGASLNNDFIFHSGEKARWDLTLHCPGETGHSCLLPTDTAAEKVTVLLNRINEFRQNEKLKLVMNPELNIGDVTSMNVTMINGGIQSNVLPSEICIRFDTRLSVLTDAGELFKTITSWCKEAGDNVWIEKHIFDPIPPQTKLDNSNVYCKAFLETMKKLNYSITDTICPGVTDIRFARCLGIPALGFSPMTNTEVKMHSNNEYLNADVFLKGIEVYYELLPAIANAL